MFKLPKHIKIKKTIGVLLLEEEPQEDIDIDDSDAYIGVTKNEVDLRVILMAMKEYMLDGKIRFSNNFLAKKTEVIVPSLKASFSLEYTGDYILLKKGKDFSYRIPCELKDGQVSDRVIDYIIAVVEHNQINSL